MNEYERKKEIFLSNNLSRGVRGISLLLLAGVDRIEQTPIVLETIVLPLYYTPMWGRIKESNFHSSRN